MSSKLLIAVAVTSILAATGCIPLTVGSTAQPVAPGETSRSMSVYVVPNSFDDTLSSRAFPRYGVDAEVRFGLDDRSDIGVRTTSLSGIVANYKRRVNGASKDPGAAVAFMVGGGLVNFGDHAHFEATLMTSAAENEHFTPYGGLRAMQVVPLNRGSVHDSPTLGGFIGSRIGTRNAGISPEIGIFYDRSALHIHKGNFLWVPAITIHGDLGRFLRPW